MGSFMTSEAKESLEEVLFSLAVQKTTAAERVAFLDGVCRGNPELRAKLEELLSAHFGEAGFLPMSQGKPSSPFDAGLPALGAHATVVTPPLESQMIGRYKLLEKIGEGGFGEVWMADQCEPVKRRVALKIIKLGMDTRQIVARFEAERQALALMDHPNIAKVFDAGATETGRPYFVMELVRGAKITDHCDKNALSAADRLKLFIQVCQAIQHAHQKGIIHRDIKPSNVLVTLHDGVPVPKVIDFGIAKATQFELTDKTVFTQFQQFIGTPAYISPEQAEPSGLDIDTRSDIYSLGVLLYELLVGQTPFDAKEMMKGGIHALRQIIREKEPQKPSTRLKTLAAVELTTTAARRHTNAVHLTQLLCGDLDWIVMKCLEKNRTRRYETANGLAMEIQRYLANEPVIARPPSAAYKVQKAWQRNKLAFSAAAAVALALVMGISVSTWQAVRATRAKLQADAARGEAQTSEHKARLAEAGQIRLREQAEAQALAARRTAYNSEINLAQQALVVNNLARARMLLDRQRPHPGQVDLRGWEWRYLWGQAGADEHEVFFTGTNRNWRPFSFSPDGQLLAWVAQGDMTVTDLISRRTVLQRRKRSRPTFAHQTPLLASFEEVSSSNRAIVLLDVTSQKETRLATLTGPEDWAAFTPDDRRLLTVSQQPKQLTVWNVASGERLFQRPLEFDSPAYALSPGGDLLAIGMDGGRFKVLDTAGGSERFSVKATPDEVFALTFSPDGKAILSGAMWTDATIQIWDTHSGTHLGALEGHQSAVTGLLFTPDGTRLVSASADQTIRLWDWSARKPSTVLRGHLNEVEGLALASDGRTLASACKDGTIFLWDISKPPRHLGYQTLPSRLRSRQAARFSLDSKFILGREANGGVALWDTFTLKEVRRLWGDSTNQSSVALSPNADRVAVGDTTGRLHIWDVASGLETTNFVAASGPIKAWFTRNGKSLLTSSHQRPGTNQVFERWNADTWQREGSVAVEDGAIGEGIREIMTTSLPDSIGIRTWKALRFMDITKSNGARKSIKLNGTYSDFALSPDGVTAATSSAADAGLVQIWDMTTLQQVESFKGFLLGSHSVAFSPDGRRLAVGSSGREAIKVWDSETRQELLTLGGEGSGFETLEFSQDGRFLLAINWAGLAHLWSAPTWEEIAAAETKEKIEAKKP